MKNKWNLLGLCSLAIAVAIFVFTYFLFHYIGSDGSFVSVRSEIPQKPFITLLFGIWGVMFLFSSVMSFLIGNIFCSNGNSTP